MEKEEGVGEGEEVGEVEVEEVEVEEVEVEEDQEVLLGGEALGGGEGWGGGVDREFDMWRDRRDQKTLLVLCATRGYNCI